MFRGRKQDAGIVKMGQCRQAVATQVDICDNSCSCATSTPLPRKPPEK